MQTEIVNTTFLNLFNDGEFVVSTLKAFFEKKKKYDANPYIPHRLTLATTMLFPAIFEEARVNVYYPVRGGS